ncbi:MAG: sigma-70 family RNA polymerase sigma factor [Planctomycetia bacterium]|nr:sigma-70 family RNA polymerase sigma factor [Planctomycetia bacterium]
MMKDYRHPALRQLKDQQVRFAPVEKRLGQLDRIEKLLTEIIPGKQYPYQYVCFRITGFRTDANPQLLIDSAELEHDLHLFIEDLNETVPPVPADNLSEPMLTLDQVSKNLKVSTKTVSRWRDKGLVTRKVLCNGRRKVAVRQSLLSRFLEQHKDDVEKGARFSQMSDEERSAILNRARRLAKANPNRFMDICRRVAKKFGRSVEAVRYTIKRHDQTQPDQVFPQQRAQIKDDDRSAIYSSFRRGISVEALASKFQRTRTAVLRIVNEVRAHRLLKEPVSYISSPELEQANAKKASEILGNMPQQAEYQLAQAKLLAQNHAGVPAELLPLYSTPLLSKEQEQHLFRKMNFLKHQASQLQKSIDPDKARASDMDRLEELLKQAQKVKDQLINANMRLVASIAKKHARPTDNFYELLSDGNLSLIKAVEKFDYSRGNKFSTYASWAIMKNYARSLPDEKTKRDRFLTGSDEIFDGVADNRTDEQREMITAESKKRQVHELLDRLDDRERRIMQLRYGINGERGMTLEQVGQREGITKERVRQIEARGLLKLKNLAEEGVGEM